MAASSSRTVKRKYPADATPPSIMMTDGPPKSDKSLKSWWDAMSQMQKDIVQEKIGFLTDLVTKPIVPRRDLVSALVGFWNPSQNTFCFKGFEMTPTLEEIAGLLKLDFEKKNMIAPRKVNEREFFNNIKVQTDLSIASVRQGWISFDYLYDRFGADNGFKKYGFEFHDKLKYEDWVLLCPKVFVFALLGLLVFPLPDRAISIKVSWTMAALYGGAPDATIIPTILGSMFHALTRCHKGESSFFEGCNLLLQVWFLEHVRPCPPRDILRCCDIDYLEHHLEHIERYKFPGSEPDWRSFLNSLTPDKILWQCSWFPKREVVHRCVDRPFLVLMGLTASQPYVPLRVLRQLGRKQEIPIVEDMSAYTSDYPLNPATLRGEILRLWDTRRHLAESTQVQDGLRGEVVREYKFWYYHQPIPKEMPARSRAGMVDTEARLDIQVQLARHEIRKECHDTIQSLIAERDAARAAQSESEGFAHQHLDTVRRLRVMHSQALTERDADRAALLESRRREDYHRQDAIDSRAQLDRALEQGEQFRRLAQDRLRDIQAAGQTISVAYRQVYDSATYVAQSINEYRRLPAEDILPHVLPFVTRVATDLNGLRRTFAEGPPVNPEEPFEFDPEEPADFVPQSP